jgi:O-antigen/teichoic acid export membrane protein
LVRTLPHKSFLRARILKAGVWTICQHGFEISTRLVSNLILTRLLVPEAFGLMAAAGSLVSGLVLIGDFGIRTVVLQSPAGDQDWFLRTAWTLQVIRGFGLWILLVVFCVFINLPPVRSYLPAYSVFATPEFSLVTAVIGFSVALGGLESMAIPLSLRRLHFRPLVLLDLAARALSLPIMIVWAWAAPSVWALVVGSLVSSAVRMTLSHVLLPGPRMSWKLNRDYVREIVHFGKWIGVSSTGTFISQQSDQIVLGFLLPTSALGTYAIAKTLIETSMSLLERLNSQLTIPVMSEVNRQSHREFKEKYYRFRLPFDLLAPLIGGILLSTGSLVISVLYDQRYSAAGPMVQILSVALPTYPALLFGAALAAVGVPRLAAAVSILQAISLLTFVFIGYALASISGAIWGIALHKLVPTAAIFIFARQRHWLDLYKEFRVVAIFVAGILGGKGLILIVETIRFWI